MKLSPDERAHIHDAIARAEQRTSARFSAVVLPASNRYGHYPLLWGAALGLTVGAGLALFAPHLSLRYAMLIAVATAAAFALVFDWFPLRLLLVPGHAKHEAARAFAHREFAARILSPRDGRDGVLFFVSLGERYVEVIATRGIHLKVGEAAWQTIVAAFVAAAKAGRLADGAVAAIDSCAAHLSAHAPKSGS